MNEDRITGAAKNLGGQVEEGLGRAAGDVKSQLQGKAKQVEGEIQELYGQAKERAADAAEVVRDRPARPRTSSARPSSSAHTRPPPLPSGSDT